MESLGAPYHYLLIKTHRPPNLTNVSWSSKSSSHLPLKTYQSQKTLFNFQSFKFLSFSNSTKPSIHPSIIHLFLPPTFPNVNHRSPHSVNHRRPKHSWITSIYLQTASIILLLHTNSNIQSPIPNPQSPNPEPSLSNIHWPSRTNHSFFHPFIDPSHNPPT